MTAELDSKALEELSNLEATLAQHRNARQLHVSRETVAACIAMMHTLAALPVPPAGTREAVAWMVTQEGVDPHLTFNPHYKVLGSLKRYGPATITPLYRSPVPPPAAPMPKVEQRDVEKCKNEVLAFNGWHMDSAEQRVNALIAAVRADSAPAESDFHSEPERPSDAR